MRKRNDGRRNHPVVLLRDVLDERSINLEAIDGQNLEISERGITGPEVVNADGDARLAQDIDLGNRVLRVVH